MASGKIILARIATCLGILEHALHEHAIAEGNEALEGRLRGEEGGQERTRVGSGPSLRKTLLGDSPADCPAAICRHL